MSLEVRPTPTGRTGGDGCATAGLLHVLADASHVVRLVRRDDVDLEKEGERRSTRSVNFICKYCKPTAPKSIVITCDSRTKTILAQNGAARIVKLLYVLTTW